MFDVSTWHEHLHLSSAFFVADTEMLVLLFGFRTYEVKGAGMVSKTLWSRLNKVYAKLGPSLQEGIYVWDVGDPIVVRGREYTPEEFHEKFPRRMLIIFDDRERWDRAEKERARLHQLNPPFEIK